MREKSFRHLSDLTLWIKGAGEMASGVACRLFRSNFHRIVMTEIPHPLAVRRHVSFCEAVHDGEKSVEGITAVKADDVAAINSAWSQGKIAVMVDPAGETIGRVSPDVLLDAVLAKRNTGTDIHDAKLVVALGPGFVAGRDAHFVIETNRGHNLGRLITSGAAEPNTGIPGSIGNYTVERVLRAGADGVFETDRKIGDRVEEGDIIALAGGIEIRAQISGVIRGLIRPGTEVPRLMKVGDIDPRGKAEYVDTVSEKARAIGGAVLEAILRIYNSREKQDD